MVVVEAIPFRTFKEKINITCEVSGRAKIEIYKDFIYIEKYSKDEEDLFDATNDYANIRN